MYKGNVEGSVFSGLASAVPGDILGLETMHRKYGVSAGISNLLQLTNDSEGSALASGRKSSRPSCQVWISR